MTTAQKIIKYLAIAFAIFLIVGIISTIIGGLYSFGDILGLKKEEEISTTEMKQKNFENTNIQALKLDILYADLKIKTGEVLRVETNIDKIEYKESENALKIEEEKNNTWFGNNNQKQLTLYIPENINLKDIDITTGAGKVEIEKLVSEKLSFELGAGEARINNIEVSNKCKIEGGAGKLTVESGNINNLDLDMGVGEVNLKAKLLGKSDIDAGIGSLNIGLYGGSDLYKIYSQKGVGSIQIDGTEIKSEDTYGHGENTIDIDGGVGSIKVDFLE